MFDLVITNATIITCNIKGEVIKSGFIGIMKGEIVEIGEMLSKTVEADNVIDAQGAIVIPGLINAHTHIGMAYFKGLADDQPLHSWLNNCIWPQEKKWLSKEFVYQAALHGMGELIRNGVTCFSDMYFYEREVAKAAQISGIRGILGEGVLDFPAGGHLDSDSMINYAVESQKELSGELISFSIAPHAIYTCGCESMLKAVKAAEDHHMMLHIHAAETRAEVEDSMVNYGKTPIQYLASIGALGKSTVLAHCVWVDDKDLALIAETGAHIVLNTKSNLKLCSGIAPVKKMLDAGVSLCFGTDSVASNNRLSILSELNITALLHKAINMDPTILTPENLLRNATIGAANALGMGDRLGSIEIGKRADICVIRSDKIEQVPYYDVYSHLVYSVEENQIDTVIVNGKILMNKRELLTINEGELVDQAKWYKERIQQI